MEKWTRTSWRWNIIDFEDEVGLWGEVSLLLQILYFFCSIKIIDIASHTYIYMLSCNVLCSYIYILTLLIIFLAFYFPSIAINSLQRTSHYTSFNHIHFPSLALYHHPHFNVSCNVKINLIFYNNIQQNPDTIINSKFEEMLARWITGNYREPTLITIVNFLCKITIIVIICFIFNLIIFINLFGFIQLE